MEEKITELTDKSVQEIRETMEIVNKKGMGASIIVVSDLGDENSAPFFELHGTNFDIAAALAEMAVCVQEDTGIDVLELAMKIKDFYDMKIEEITDENGVVHGELLEEEFKKRRA